MEIALFVAALGAVYAAGTFVLQRKVSNIKRVNEITKSMKALQKEFSAMVKEKAPDAEIKKKQDDMMKMMNESMKYQMKAMIVILPLFLIIYYGVLPVLMGFIGITSNTTPVVSHPLVLTYPLLFIVVAFVTGIVLLIAVTLRDRRKNKMQAAAAATGVVNT